MCLSSTIFSSDNDFKLKRNLAKYLSNLALKTQVWCHNYVMGTGVPGVGRFNGQEIGYPLFLHIFCLDLESSVVVELDVLYLHSMYG